MLDLDDVLQVKAQDPADMLSRISELPVQCQEAWIAVGGWDPPTGYDAVRHVVVLGMGGSAIGGALMQGLVSPECGVPITVVRGYDPPAFVAGEEYLAVACSYSGNTEETLAAFSEALRRGARGVAVSSGGQLSRLATEKGIPLLHFEYESQPRAALGYLLILLLGSLWRLGLIRDLGPDVADAVGAMVEFQRVLKPEIAQQHNPAKALAQALVGRLPAIYGSGFLAPVANRWKTQFNENAKQWSLFEVLPELNHNAVVGLGIPAEIRDRVTVITLRSRLEDTRMRARWNATEDLLEREGVVTASFQGSGDSPLAQMLSLILLGDYTSLYLGLLNDVDPTPVEPIAFLKRQLAKLG
jgi:glucose/mannose-6-phosphate isomerase